jgi:ribose transport system permease protein
VLNHSVDLAPAKPPETSAARPRQRRASERFLGWASRYGTIASLVIFVIMFSVLRPSVFPTSLNFFNILNQVSILGIIALGLTVALVQGLFDLSVAAVATLGGFLATSWLANGTVGSAVVAVLLVLVIALLIGAVNGVIVSYGGISAFIATLASGSIITGAVLGISHSQTVLSGIPDTFLIMGQGMIGPIPAPVLFFAVFAVVLYFVLEQTEQGRHMYAIGGNAEAARLSGIAVKRYALLALAISAACAALGGMIVAANLGVGRPQGVGDTYLLDAFAASFIGASTLRPGRFHVFGTVIGVLLIGVINNGLSILGVETFWQYAVRGALLLVAVLGAGFLSARRQ